MKWKGRRQSKNVVVIPNDPIQRIIQKESEYIGGGLPLDRPRKQKLPEKGPIPTPRPMNIQVTPGKWITK